jgi:hypothetical protein
MALDARVKPAHDIWCLTILLPAAFSRTEKTHSHSLVLSSVSAR